MGIGRLDVELLGQLRAEGCIPDHAKVIELGAQQLSHSLLRSEEVLVKLGRLFGVGNALTIPIPNAPPDFDGIEEKLAPDAPMARKLWTWLGFDYASIDIDGSPGSIPLDLNYDDVPHEEKSKYNLVTNFGTTEHVANQLNAFKIIHDLAAVRGIMMHHLPAQGNFNHGLINYNPKFFWMLARSNEYRWLYFDFTKSGAHYELPRNVLESVKSFRPNIVERMHDYKIVNASLIVILQKTQDAIYVAPIDVPTGAKTNTAVLLKRYPTVFKPAR
jgi:hypothetical protein